MREILFRGKTEAGEWVEGFLIGRYDPSQKGHIIKSAYIDNGTCFYSPEKVIPETVGQFTDAIDKNGKRIFEGDVVDFYFFDKGSKNTKTMLIEWRDNGFWMRELFRDYRLADDFSIIKEKIFTYRGDIRHGVYISNNVYFVEVIGNIHDNPELLTAAEANQKAD